MQSLVGPFLVQVEAAYDLLFMQQMSARLRGEIPVSTKVRFADVPQRRPSPPKVCPLLLLAHCGVLVGHPSAALPSSLLCRGESK